MVSLLDRPTGRLEQGRTMRSNWKVLAAGLVCSLALLATACSSGSSSGGGGSSKETSPGVTETEIKIGVAVSDLDGLRASGISLAPALTTGNLSKRITSYFDEWNAAGGIQGRKVVPVVITWDPVKPATQEKVCADATINNELLAFVNANGMGAKYIQCISDAGVPVFFGDTAPLAAYANDTLTTIAAPVEIMASAGTQGAIDAGTITKTTKVGILNGNGPEHIASTAAVKKVLAKAGVPDSNITTVNVNTLVGDPAVASSEAAAAVNTFKAAGVTNVLVGLQFTSSTGFWDNVKPDTFKYTILDTASSNCTQYGAARVKPSAIGATCYTVFGDSVDKNGLRPETAFEKECRAKFDALSAKTNDYPSKSYPGVPSGDTIKLADGTILSSDYPPNECTFVTIFKRAFDAIGKKAITRESFMKAVRNLGAVDIALASDGKGSQSPGKVYLSDYIHGDLLTPASKDTPRSANGTWNGCPTPVNCFVPATPWSKLVF